MVAEYSEDILGIEPDLEYRFDEASGNCIAYGSRNPIGTWTQPEDAGSGVTRMVAGPSADYLAYSFDGVNDSFFIDFGGTDYSEANTGTFLMCFRIPPGHTQTNTSYCFSEVSNGAFQIGFIIMGGNSLVEWIFSSTSGVYRYLSDVLLDAGEEFGIAVG